MTSDIRLRGILVATAVLAYAAAGISDVVLAFSPAVDAKHALAAACVMGVGRFIPFMGYVGSIAFIPPVLAGVVMWGIDRLREGNRK